jgi:prepilin peptidase CpaA
MSAHEFTALKDLLGMLFFDPGMAVLMVLLVIAGVSDCRTRRIPNVLVASGALFGLIYNIALPQPGHHPILFPLAGLALGMALLLPLYLIRAMGAGDVKLLGMVGAFLGPLATFHAALATFIVGGVLAIIFVIRRGTALRLVENLSQFVRLGVFGVVAGSLHIPRVSAGNSAGRLPYGVAIAMGTIGYLILHQLGAA